MSSSLNPKWYDFFDGGMHSLIFGDKGPNLAALAVVNENQRKLGIEKGQQNIDKEFAGFNDQFYNKRAQDYINYAMPQLGEQARAQNKSMVYGLNQQGVQNSSIARNASSSLGRQIEAQKQALAEQGITQAQELQRQVEESRQGLYNQVLSASDPSGTLGQANSVAARYQQPSTFAPFVNTASAGFQSYANTKTIENAALANSRYSQYAPPTSTTKPSSNGYSSTNIKS